MIEQVGNIFEQVDAYAIGFTSNGVVKRQGGDLVMGAGVAKLFKEKYPVLPKIFGELVRTKGNHVYFTAHYGAPLIFSFPTKKHFAEKADLKLIEQSAKELVIYVTEQKFNIVYLCKPGCGLGGLDWETQVKPVISPILDDRFIILSF